MLVYKDQFQVQSGADILAALPGPAWQCCLWTSAWSCLTGKGKSHYSLAEEHAFEAITLLIPRDVQWFPSQSRLLVREFDSFWMKLKWKLHCGRSPNALWPLIGVLPLGTKQSQSEIIPPEDRRFHVPSTSCLPLHIFAHWVTTC